MSWYKELWKGLPIRSVQQVEVKQKPSIVLKHDYDESLKRDDFIIEIDEIQLVNMQSKAASMKIILMSEWFSLLRLMFWLVRRRFVMVVS